MQEKILDFLRRKQHYVSGDQIAARLGISRQALWKHIQELKNMGYDIVAVPHLGYQLKSAPDRLFAFEVSYELNTEFLGRKIHYFEALPSTMNVAMQLGIEGCPCGTLILAESQTHGRGRLGRSWISPKYKGIYLSLILRPKILPQKAPILTLLAAVSICEAIKEISGLDTQIKWPNDILLSHKKLGGILTELSAEMDRVSFIILGIGLNVNNDKKTLISGATSLKTEKKEDVNRISLLQEILRKIEKNYLVFQEEGSEPVIEKWRQFNVTLGNRIKIASQDKRLEGQAIDIDTDGGLLVRKDSGMIEKIMTADIVHCR
jgi:BirA family transcriptional regulator, biotin operon repressor / biotin---[acetyl-CoA-carboxylase] ligase